MPNIHEQETRVQKICRKWNIEQRELADLLSDVNVSEILEIKKGEDIRLRDLCAVGESAVSKWARGERKPRRIIELALTVVEKKLKQIIIERETR